MKEKEKLKSKEKAKEKVEKKTEKHDSYFVQFQKWLKRNMTWVYFTIAIVFILFPNTKYSPLPNLGNSIMEKIGFVALTSGVFAGVLKSIQFSGLFKEELTKIISGSDFLKNRKDLPDLWKKISKIIYSEKFPEISSLLEDRILTTYFPKDKNHYNEDVVISMVIHSITDDLIINYTQTLEYYAVLDNEKTESTVQYTQTITDDNGVNEKNELITFEVDDIDIIKLKKEEKEKFEGSIGLSDDENKDNKEPEENGKKSKKESGGADIKDQPVKAEIQKDKKKEYVYSYPIKDKKRSKVLLKFENTYSLKGENFKLLRFNTITRNVDVTVSYPKEIEVSFFNIGLINKFKPIHRDMVNSLSRRHRDDLILPKQGFGLSFNKC
ncbi:hypothetical protein [Zunongwangia sp. H14]|uniref:hypothetical protein n=1 Tax=Zunongwangia sp. H14 TaxID=3240792 RepID=UPI003567A38A